MKKLLMAGVLALSALGLCQGNASALCFDVHKPCYEILLPPIPICCPSIKIRCVKCPCNGSPYVAPNPWYTYYPPTAYGPQAHMIYPVYGPTAPPAHVGQAAPAAPVNPDRITPTSGSAKGKGVVPTTAQTAPAQPVAQQPISLQNAIPGSYGAPAYNYSAPSYWYRQ